MHIGIATYQHLAQLASDDQHFVAALRQRGHTADALVWDDPRVVWQRYDAIVVRSCWDYHTRPAEFLAWIDRLELLGVPLWNPPTLLRWNHQKRYLLDLAARGVTIVPTVYLERGAHADLAQLIARHQWHAAVVKPAIAATAFHTWQTSTSRAVGDQARFAELLAERDLLVQPLMPQIQDGEWSLLFFGGQFSHAVLKRPAPGDFRSQDDFGGTAERHDPPPDMVAQAAGLLETIDELWLYARVDGLMVGSTFTLMELELIEPSLFFSFAASSAEMMAIALERLSTAR